MTTDTTGRYAPMPEPGDVRASGGIVHSDGNVFFTNIEKMGSLLRAYADATCALRAAQRPVCQTCNGVGLIGGHSGQTPESYQEHSEDCPDCTPQRPAAQDDRAAFEAWLNPSRHAGNLSPWIEPGRYEKEAHQLAWLAWRAALASRPVPPPMTADDLWDNNAVMRINAELGLTMDQIVRFARAIMAARDAQWKGGV